MEISKEAIDTLKEEAKKAYDRVVDMQVLRIRNKGLSTFENIELEKRWAYYNGLRTVLDIFKIDY